MPPRPRALAAAETTTPYRPPWIRHPHYQAKRRQNALRSILTRSTTPPSDHTQATLTGPQRSTHGPSSRASGAWSRATPYIGSPPEPSSTHNGRHTVDADHHIGRRGERR